jgi:DNA-binding SARP family transcriptional activator
VVATGAVLQSAGALTLLDGFRLEVGGCDVVVPGQAQRVLAYLAVSRRSQPRQILAEKLWSDVPNDRCQASLRTALWRIRRCGPRLIRSDRLSVDLDPLVDVDLHRTLAQAHRLIDGRDLTDDDASPDALQADLLPDWDEDWVLFEREQLRQLRLHALEALSAREREAGRHAYAIATAQAAVAAEPLRESAWAALIEAHLAEGNVHEARRALSRFAVLLWAELRMQPSAGLRGRVADALAAAG